MSPALKKLQWKAYSYRHIIAIECLMAWERNTGYALGAPKERISVGSGTGRLSREGDPHTESYRNSGS